MQPMLEARVFYCVPCGYLGLATFIANELFAEGGEQIALLLIPALHGILEVQLQGETVYDKLAEDRFPTPPRVAEVRRQLRARLDRLNAHQSAHQDRATGGVASISDDEPFKI